MRTRTVADIAASTPVTRNRVVDLLRVGALSVVVLGHWLLAAVWLDDGELSTGAVLGLATWTHPLTWVFQVMPIFFLVGGFANARSWRAARRRGEAWPTWLRTRLRRLLTPVVPLLLFWVAALAVAGAAGADPAMLRTASQTALVPTWFLAAYAAVCAVAPLTLWVWERTGWWSVAAGLALGGVVDAVSLGTGSTTVGFANYLVVWATVHQVGYAWLDGRLGGTRRRVGLALAGLVGLVLLVWFGPYPVSMVGLDDAVVNNSYPTRVTLGFLGLLQGGAVLALEPRMQRWMARPLPWARTVVLGSRIMSVYLWHLTAMVLVLGLGLLVAPWMLAPEPLSLAWWLTRPVWWGVLAAATGGMVALVGRFERPPPDPTPVRVPAWRAVTATVLGCGGLGVMAARGLVGPDGLSWWWAMVPVAGVLLLSARRASRVAR